LSDHVNSRSARRPAEPVAASDETSEQRVAERLARPKTPTEIKTLLGAAGLRAQRGMGQNFLTSDAILEKIVAAGDVGPNDVVVEVGPGLGHLTHHLARAAGQVVAVEVDRGLIRELRQAFRGVPNVTIVEGDILDSAPTDLVGDRAYKVVANLPYYITSAALRHFLEASHRPSLLVVTLQREVGERITAAPGQLSLLAIGVQVFGRPRLVSRIPPNAFYPQPKVESVVLRVDVFDRPAITAGVEPFFRVVSAGFAMPRKQLHNSLAQRLWLPPGSAPEIIEAAGIDPARRPQTLSIGEWDRLTRELGRRGLV
jgi:16S rRNA (adenine1518-N6/adenine1519-N6)-dimethyltransferase